MQSMSMVVLNKMQLPLEWMDVSLDYFEHLLGNAIKRKKEEW